ncbi:uncharacterized protein [Nicotiana tomentosiformis]|uniref:uncharacterized protein n=1 Tax=Nicotiana tomentosiformis TaxID=4098 RepID=UPI00388C46AA
MAFALGMDDGSTKMYHDLKEVYWLNNMKRNVADFVARCLNCQQVKGEHPRPGGLAQNIVIPMWKWEMINMDFMGSWDDHFQLIEFAYNNSFHASIQMAFEALYGFPHEGYYAVWEKGEIESEKVVGDPSAIVPVETIEGNEELSYEEILVAILDRQVRKLRNKEIASVKVSWQNKPVEEATWEAEEEMKKKYPYLFE